MANPHPRPTKIKILNGEPNQDRINRKEPQPREGRPTMPPHLNKPAQTEWKRIIPELQAMGILTKVDRAALAGYCQAWGKWVQVENKIKKLTNALEAKGHDAGDLYLLKQDSEKANIKLLLNASRDNLELMKSFLTEFGMTPSSRSRITVEKDTAKEDELEEFLNTGRMN